MLFRPIQAFRSLSPILKQFSVFSHFENIIQCLTPDAQSREIVLSVSGVLTLNTFYDIVLYFETADHKFHISKCLCGSTLQYLQFYRSNSGTFCIKRIHNNETGAQVSMCFILHLMQTIQHGLCCYANRSATKQNCSRLGRLVHADA